MNNFYRRQLIALAAAPGVTNEQRECEAIVEERALQDGEPWLLPRRANSARRPYKLDDPELEVGETGIAAVVVCSVRLH